MSQGEGVGALYTKRLEWTGPAHSSVICTGDFDEWKGTQLLSKDSSSGKWVADLKLPYGQKDIKYKFVVDGTWQHALDQQMMSDDAGNTNNVFSVPDGPSEVPEESSLTESSIQEGDIDKSIATIQSEQDGERDIPKSLQDLFSGNTSGEGNAFGGPGGTSGGSGGAFQHPGFVTYNMQNFATVKHIEPMRQNYPSKYLLQTADPPTTELTPTDTMIAVEYILTRFRSVNAQHQARNRKKIELEETVRAQEKIDKDGQDDKKLLEIEEGGGAEGSNDASPGETTSKSTTTTSSKSKTLPPIQVPGIAKLYSSIKEAYPGWNFSEKRLRKVIKEDEAMKEAERIIRLMGWMGAGKHADEMVAVSRYDYKLEEELDAQWAANHGTSNAVNGGNSSSTKAKVPTESSESTNGESSKVNGDPVASTSNSAGASSSSGNVEGGTGKNKKKKGKSGSASGAAALLNGVAEVAEAVVDKVSNALPSNHISSSTSTSTPQNSTTNTTTTDPSKRNPTNAVGDVALKWFGPLKGRGVIARRKFKRGSVIFKEDAFAFAPTKTIQSHINEGRACAFCGKLFISKASALVVPCVAHDHLPSSSSSTARNSSKGPSSRKVSGSKVGGNSSSSASAKKKGDVNGEEITAAEDKDDDEKRMKRENFACNMKYCTKLCRDKSTEYYANLLCPAVNPSFRIFMRWAETVDGRSMKQNPVGVFFIFLRLIVLAQKPEPGAVDEALDLLYRLESLAAIGDRNRRGRELNVLADMQYGQDWLTGYRLVTEALQLPEKYYIPAHPEDHGYKGPGSKKASQQPSEQEDGENSKDKDFDDIGEHETPSSRHYPGTTLQHSDHGGINALPEWYRNKDLPTALEERLLGFDNYLIWLGRVALNQEDDGGIFLLHPCMNHDCQPSASVRRTPALNGQGAREARPSRIFVLADRDIEEGEEITVAYVNPQNPFNVRRQVLKSDYLFDCPCQLCEKQLAEYHGTRGAITASNGDHDNSTTTVEAEGDDDDDIFALAIKAPPGATVDENYAAKMRTNNMSNANGNGHDQNGSNGEDDDETAIAPVKLSAATIKKKKKKAALKRQQEEAEAQAAAKAHALDPMGFFKNDKPSVPWYEEDDI